MSEHSAISEPPATAKPCTLAMTGRWLRHSDMNSSVLRIMKA